MKQEVTNSCGRKGCDSDRITLPWDGRTIRIRGRVQKGRHDIAPLRKTIELSVG